MAQTNQAWDWGVELRDEERSELELLRGTLAQLRTQLDQAHESLTSQQTARTGRKPGIQAARRSQAVAQAPGADGATRPLAAVART
jgi:outer membrane PBP1 activator LpoA protein